ncbi:increased DNA methylation 1-like [Amborella trichopoda]|uniref:increased DNA methylation 1-like n=1 Tax=Amborella trichopoda TaxID=13333 RepID=UPI0009BD5347|nr:increased DNA methylation 1-like [Amborella trichopoda]|eukprot:XP_020530843.1 increased DNA methylation 1-like [Amborella trichopoda]
MAILERQQSEAPWAPEVSSEVVRYEVELEAEYCPEAITEYLNLKSQRGNKRALLQEMMRKAKMHLLASGWKLERRLAMHHYISSSGKVYYCLYRACIGYKREEEEEQGSTRSCIDQTGSTIYEPCPPSINSPPNISFYSKTIERGTPKLPISIRSSLIEELTSGSYVDVVSDVEMEDFSLPENLVEEEEEEDWVPAGDIRPSILKKLGVIEKDKDLKPVYSPVALRDYLLLFKSDISGGQKIKFGKLMAPKVMAHLLAIGWSLSYSLKNSYRSNANKELDLSNSVATLVSLPPLCTRESSTRERQRQHHLVRATDRRGYKTFKDSSVSWENKNQQGLYRELCNLLGTHGTQKKPRDMSLRSGRPSTRTVLSWMIDHNVILPREKLSYYVGGEDNRVKGEARVTRVGIKCNCCSEVYRIADFEAHAKTPSSQIFVGDGRSLYDCQRQMLDQSVLKDLRLKSCERKKADYNQCESDEICSICHYGGELVLCDCCPSAYHLACLHLKDLPEGDWFCPSCCCAICDGDESNADRDQFNAKTFLNCEQCNHNYHVGCYNERGSMVVKSYPKGNWFCSKKCSDIHTCLNDLLGKRIPTKISGITWTLLRGRRNRRTCNNSEIEEMTGYHCKLCVAYDILHECFVPVIEPWTNRDIVVDLLSNNRFELKRLDFGGFYTLILENEDDEMISVATIRIHGEKIAELPLVGTSVKFRRQSMCHLLIDGLEKLLAGIGVERLLLPAANQVKKTWETSFGFQVVEDSEKKELIKYLLPFCSFSISLHMPFLQRTFASRHAAPPLQLWIEGAGGSQLVRSVLMHSTSKVELETTGKFPASRSEQACFALATLGEAAFRLEVADNPGVVVMST